MLDSFIVLRCREPVEYNVKYSRLFRSGGIYLEETSKQMLSELRDMQMDIHVLKQSQQSLEIGQVKKT